MQKEYDIAVNFENQTIETSLPKLVRNDYNNIKLKFAFDIECSKILFKLKRPLSKNLILEIVNNELILGPGILIDEGNYYFEICAYDNDIRMTNYAKSSFEVRNELVSGDEAISPDEHPEILDGLIRNIEELQINKADKIEIPDVTELVTNATDNLVNYYLKSETYTKNEVNNLIGDIENVSIQVVEELPSTGESNVIYFVPKEGSLNDVYNEYVYVSNDYELIGTTETDLSNYVTMNNTTEYSPTPNSYNPATTKYVDDLVASAVGGFSYTDITEETNLWDLEDGIYKIMGTNIPINYSITNKGVKSKEMISSGAILIVSKYNHPTTGTETWKAEALYDNIGQLVIYSMYSFGDNGNGSHDGGVSRRIDSNYALNKNNQISYNVTHNYNPAHKLYVDTAINNAVGDINAVLATLTTVEESE